MKANSDWILRRRRKLDKPTSFFFFPTSLVFLKDDLDVLLKLLVIGGVVATTLPLAYFYSIHFPEVFLPVLGSSPVMWAFIIGAVFGACYLVFIFVLPVLLLEPGSAQIAGMYAKFGISTRQQVRSLLAFPVAMLLSYFSQEWLGYTTEGVWQQLTILLWFQLIILGWEKRKDAVRINFSMRWLGLAQYFSKPGISLAFGWFWLACYWWFVSLFLSFPMLVILKWGSMEELWQLLFLLLYVVMLGGALAVLKRGGWRTFSVIVVFLIFIALFWANEKIGAGAARMLGARHDEPRWYWVDTKIIPASLEKLDKGCYLKAMTPFSTVDIHILCRDKDHINHASCVLALDKTDAKPITGSGEMDSEDYLKRRICFRPFGVESDRTGVSTSNNPS